MTLTATATRTRPGSHLTWGGYSRISEDPNDERAGVTRQYQDIADAVSQLGGTPPAHNSETMWVENDTGAFKRKKVTITDHYGETRTAYRVVRPKWAKALRDLRSGKINALMVYDLDRLARDPYDLEDAIEAVEYFGATIVSATASEVDLKTESGRMSARLLVMMGNKSSADTARRVKRAHQASAMGGKPVGGNRPFGFMADKITHHPEEAALIREAVADVLNGVSMREIARKWQEAGVPTVRGRPWHRTSIRQMLKGPRLAGWRVHQGKKAHDENGEPIRLRDPKTGEPVEPIIDQDTFDRLQQILSQTKGPGPKSRRGSRQYLLSGIVRCGICASTMYGHIYDRGPDGEPRFSYVCQGDTSNPHINSISGHRTDAAIEEAALQRLTKPTIEAPDSTFPGAARLETVKGKIAELLTAYDADQLDGDFVFPRVAKLRAERDQLDLERDQFIEATAGPTSEQLTPEAWSEMEIAEKRGHLERRLDSVIVRPAKMRGNRFDLTRVDPIWRGTNQEERTGHE